MCDLLREFVSEAADHLDGIEAALCGPERLPRDPSVLLAVLRRVHNLKGTAGFLDLPRLEALLHAAETHLDAVRNGTLDGGADERLVRDVLDRMRGLLAALDSAGAEPPGTDLDLLDRLGRSTRQGVGEERSFEALPDAGETRAGPSHPFGAAATPVRDSVVRGEWRAVAAACSKLPRLVQDLSDEFCKPIRLVLEGDGDELDGVSVDRLRDCLVHLVRNAAAHGLESVDAREAAGKPATGVIRIEAARRDGRTTVRLSDDGMGLDLAAIRRRLSERALLPDGVIARLSDDALGAWIFTPGFTTARSLTTTSGRGLGLDIVKTNLATLGGTVSVRSTPGVGTTFVLSIPRREVMTAPGRQRVGSRAGWQRAVLLVDGNPLIRRHVSSLLTDAGFDVTVADARSAALAALDRGSFGAAIVAARLGSEDGLRLASQVRQHPAGRDMSLVLLASAPSPAERAEARALGAAVVSRLDRTMLLDVLARSALAA